MKIGINYCSSKLRRPAALSVGSIGAALVLAALSGCETDSFMDPSVLGRWQPTPTVVPVLDRISSIEDESGEFVQTSPVQSGDLAPEAEQYRFGPGDQIEVRLRDYFVIGQEEPFKRVIDSRGYLDLPRLPPIRATGRNIEELRVAIEEAIRAQRINDRPVVAIQIESQRKQTFSVLGAVHTPSTYYIPSPDYRLLEGITVAGGFEESIPYVYVIRQVYLSDEAAGVSTMPEPTSQPRIGPPRTAPIPEAPKGQDEDLGKLIEQLSQPPKEPKPSPGVFGQPGAGGAAPSRPGTAPGKDAGPPPIDLPDSGSAQATAPTPAPSGKSGWVYMDGKWVKAGGTDAAGSTPGAKRQSTQRVIKIPTAPLLAGAADVNIVLRPGDVVRVPPAKAGLVYMGGNIARPGPYTLPAEGRLTLLRAVQSAGGIGSIGIPERTDITRRIGDDRQATVRINLRAIAEGTQPDLYLKPDDMINIGTNFWATPLAIVRNGFRFSYGFGFILDRNFDTNVYGPIPQQGVSGG